ncbi:MAG: caspase domain-containing protein [Acidobacteriota bacterium]|nr:caspase domain-containing protein [Acidobacteriota bacterium]
MNKTLLLLALTTPLAIADFAAHSRPRPPAPAQFGTERRVALVVGNGSYKVGPLRNPVNDARDMARVLRELGFEVLYQEDAGLGDMKRAVREFAGKIRDGGVGLFYYAGHGVQVKGINYLVPVNAEVEREVDAEDECLDAGFVLRQMEDARSRVNILILDACRNNPFARSFRSRERGLALMDSPRGTLIAYATAPGSVASDGEGRNGIYTEELLRHVRTPGLSVEDFFKRVRVSVLNRTQGQQTPWESSSLTDSFYFNPSLASTVTEGSGTAEPFTRPIPGAYKPAPEAAAPPPKKTDAARVSVRSFTIELDSCRASGGAVVCQFMVTNNSGGDKQFSLCHKDYRAARRGLDVTKALDASGNDYALAESFIGTRRWSQSSYNQAVLPAQVPVKVSLRFDNVPQESVTFSLVRIAVAEQTNMVNLSYADFKNIPIIR